MNVQSAPSTASALPIIGRESQLSAFKNRFDSGSWHKPLIITGPAGIGKTTLLRAYEEIAREAGWRVLFDTPVKGLSARISGTSLPAICESLQGMTCPEFEEKTLSQQLLCLTKALQKQGEGLLICLDQPGRGAASNLRELLDAVQQASQQNLPVQLVLAARGADLRDLILAPGMDFLAGAEQINLCSLTRNQVETAIRQVCEASCPDSGCTLSDELISKASLATYGYPVMVHLVGECLRRQNQYKSLTDEHLTRQLAGAQEKLGALVLEPLLAKLSAGDRAFLEAMAQDDLPSKMSDIASRLGKNPQYAGVYRNRLVEAQIIRAASYGKVTFTIPHLREYLREQTAAEDSFSTF